jgi:hypothetical protein
MTSTVRIHYYTTHIDVPQQWNEICARAVELFGLPGDRYTTNFSHECIYFNFKSNKDALMFAIEHNGHIISENEKTVDFMGRFLQ